MNQLLLIFLTAFVVSITAEEVYHYEFVLKVMNVSNAKQQVKGNVYSFEFHGKDDRSEIVTKGYGDLPQYVDFKSGKEIKGSVSLAENSIENVHSVLFGWDQVTSDREGNPFEDTNPAEIEIKMIFIPKNHTTGSSKSFCHEGGVEPYSPALFLSC